MNLHEIKTTKRRQDLRVGDRVICRAHVYTPRLLDEHGVITERANGTFRVLFDDGRQESGYFWMELKPE